MKKVINIVFLTFLVVFLSSSCSDDSTTAPNQSENLIPLKTGNYWELKISEHYEGDYEWQGRKFKIGKEKKVNGENFYEFIVVYITRDKLVEDYGYDKYSRDTVYIRKGDEGYYINNEEYTYLFLKYPIEPGDSWTIISPSETDTVKCISKNINVATPIDNYECISYKLSGSPSPFVDAKYYISKGIGFIGEVEGGLNDYKDRKRLLNSYNLE